MTEVMFTRPDYPTPGENGKIDPVDQAIFL